MSCDLLMLLVSQLGGCREDMGAGGMGVVTFAGERVCEASQDES